MSLVSRALDPPGEALPDWEIFARVGRALGHREAFAWRTAAQVHAEYAALTAGRLCDQTHITHARLRRDGPLRWGGDRLYASRRFPTPTGRARLAPTPHAEPAEATGPDFPLVLMTGRVAQQWHTMTRTGKSPSLLEAEPEPFVELHPDDAGAIADGQPVLVRSRRGTARMRARVTSRVPAGTAFAPFHWGALHLAPGATALNAVTANHVDPVSLQPELKACAVRVEAVRAGARPGRARRRLVVVGAGMAAMATVEALLAHSDEFAVTLIGRETAAPYNRVLLSKALSRGVDDERLALKPADWFSAHGVELRLGTAARRIDLAARDVELDDGARVPYDELLLATGSAPWVPPIAGLERARVFRTLDDMRAIRSAAGGVRRAAVIGGGLLGLEAARGLRELGAAVTVIHLADRLMELQLDALAARLLERRIRALGIDVQCGRRTEAITDAGVALADGTLVPAELVVLATGIRPEVSLARDAGLEIGRGVLVDDALRASAPGVWAVGECAEHRGTVYGLWAPVLDQAQAAGAALAGRPAAFHGAIPATTLKVAGVDLFCAGRAAEPDERAEEVLALDSRRERYRKLVLHEGRLAGATLLGDLADAGALRRLIASGASVPEALLQPAGEAAEPDSLICSCRVVARSEILATGLKTVEAVGERTGAGTGCGGCRPDIAALI